MPALVAALGALVLLACTPGAAPVAAPSASPTLAPPLTSTTAPTTAPHIEATAARDPTPAPLLTIAFVGDLMLARDMAVLMEEEGAGYPFERVAPLFQGAHLLVGNLEGQLTERGVPLEKVYTFRTPPHLAQGLAGAGFGALSLANNHMYDYDREGLEDTLAALARAGIAGYGAGMTERDARAPAVLDVEGWRIALLAYDDIGEVRFAEGETPGVAHALAGWVAEDVARAREAADVVVVSFHWGVEYSHAPMERQRALARAAVDAGADAVVGHHPHVLQPWERSGDAVVLYSLGNFVFDLDSEDLEVLGPGPFQSAMALLTFSRDAPPAVEFRPAFIDPIENRPRPATDDEAEAILRLLREEGAPVP